jgi:hypothetical protein
VKIGEWHQTNVSGLTFMPDGRQATYYTVVEGRYVPGGDAPLAERLAREDMLGANMTKEAGGTARITVDPPRRSGTAVAFSKVPYHCMGCSTARQCYSGPGSVEFVVCDDGQWALGWVELSGLRSVPPAVWGTGDCGKRGIRVGSPPGGRRQARPRTPMSLSAAFPRIPVQRRSTVKAPTNRIGTFVAASVLALTAAAAEGQTVITGGAKGGITLATIPAFAPVMAEVNISTGYRPGVLAGGFVAVEFGRTYAFQPEFLYATKGVDVHLPDYPFKGSVDLSYFEIPLLFRVSPETRGRVGLDLFLGPALAFRLGAALTSQYAESSDLEAEFKATDVGVVLGGGLHIGRVLIEARWTEGLANISSHQWLGDRDYRNRAFSVLVGYKFR